MTVCVSLFFNFDDKDWKEVDIWWKSLLMAEIDTQTIRNWMFHIIFKLRKCKLIKSKWILFNNHIIHFITIWWKNVVLLWTVKTVNSFIIYLKW